MVLALVETATRSTTTEAGVSISNQDAGAKITFEEGDPCRARKSGTISIAQRTGRSREHLYRNFEDRSRKSESDHYLVARADRSLRKRLRGQRHANQGIGFANEIRIRPVLLHGHCGGASGQSEAAAEHAGLPVSGLRSFARRDELV